MGQQVGALQNPRMQPLIRTETPADVTAVATVTEAAFLLARHSSHTEHVIVNALRQAGQLSASLVALADARVIGHVAVSPVQVSDGSVGWFGLGPLSVLPECQRQGVGGALVRAALAALQARAAAGCVLLGDPQYYGRFGFRALPQLWLADVPPEYFQALRWRGPMPAGEVRYHAAFSATN